MNRERRRARSGDLKLLAGHDGWLDSVDFASSDFGAPNFGRNYAERFQFGGGHLEEIPAATGQLRETLRSSDWLKRVEKRPREVRKVGQSF